MCVNLTTVSQMPMKFAMISTFLLSLFASNLASAADKGKAPKSTKKVESS